MGAWWNPRVLPHHLQIARIVHCFFCWSIIGGFYNWKWQQHCSQGAFPIGKSIIGRFSDRLWKSLAIWNTSGIAHILPFLNHVFFNVCRLQFWTFRVFLVDEVRCFSNCPEEWRARFFISMWIFPKLLVSVFCTEDAHVCSRTFTYVHVFSRMFTYVRVLRKSSTTEILTITLKEAESLFPDFLQFCSHSVAWCV